MRRTLVVGVGNDFRGDDGAGLEVARRLRAEGAPADVVESDGDGAALAELWAGADFVVVVDASAPNGEPGAVRRYDATAAPLPAALARHSTHAFGVAEAIELSRALGELPARIVVYAIEGEAFDAGAPLSPDVARAVDAARAAVLDEVLGRSREP